MLDVNINECSDATKKEPKSPQRRPKTVTPPLNPRGTFVNVTIETGSFLLIIPNTLDQVSEVASAREEEKPINPILRKSVLLVKKRPIKHGIPLARTCSKSLLFPFFSFLFTALLSFDKSEDERKKNKRIKKEEKPPKYNTMKPKTKAPTKPEVVNHFLHIARKTTTNRTDKYIKKIFQNGNRAIELSSLTTKLDIIPPRIKQRQKEE